MSSSAATGSAESQITITFQQTTGAGPQPDIQTEECDYLVIACDPSFLVGICDYSDFEKSLFQKFVNFTFHTTLLKVEVNAEKQADHGVIFAPSILNGMVGGVYGYRNETAKKLGGVGNAVDGVKAANALAYNYVTVYQLVRTKDAPPEPDTFKHWIKDLMHAGLNKDVNWPYGSNYKILDSVTTPYFDHFSDAHLQDELPWRYLDIQGERNTLFVHASASFESVVDIYQYINLLLDKENQPVGAPENQHKRVVILGAGPSGLLFANALRNRGYTNVEIFEKTGRYGGKTHTKTLSQSLGGGNETPVVCELGTCYLSPAYRDFVADMTPFLDGNREIGFGGAGGNFRGIMTKGQFPSEWQVAPVVEYGKYILLKAAAETGEDPNDDTAIVKRIQDDLRRYVQRHEAEMHGAKPMPLKPPKDFLRAPSSQTFLDFLSAKDKDGKDLKSLIGLLQFGYSVQGYGTLDHIPAYYGLVWFTPVVAQAISKALVNPNLNVVTAWELGWGNLWAQMVKPNPGANMPPLQIRMNVDTLRIKRPSLANVAVT